MSIDHCPGIHYKVYAGVDVPCMHNLCMGAHAICRSVESRCGAVTLPKVA